MNPDAKPLHFALLGSRGIPACYGGYETLMEELAVRLVEAGYRVTVYCRSHFTAPDLESYKGVELVVLPTLHTKYLDTPVHTLLSCLHGALFRRRDFDAALVVNSANALFVPLLRLGGIPTALHVDGIEKRRAKWGPLGRLVYALSERLACFVPTELVTDADVIRDHYLRRYGAGSVTIAYGVEPDPPPEVRELPRLGLESRRYFLYVSRFERENNPHRVVEAYREVGGDLPMVMVGGAPYARRFIEGFTAEADERVKFPGPVYGEGYRELLTHTLAYVHGTEVGGTHPALVEAMGYGCCPVVNDTPENREVAGDAGLYFQASRPTTLTVILDRLRENPDEAAARGEMAAKRAQELYSWRRVSEQYAELLTRLAGSGSPSDPVADRERDSGSKPEVAGGADDALREL